MSCKELDSSLWHFIFFQSVEKLNVFGHICQCACWNGDVKTTSAFTIFWICSYFKYFGFQWFSLSIAHFLKGIQSTFYANPFMTLHQSVLFFTASILFYILHIKLYLCTFLLLFAVWVLCLRCYGMCRRRTHLWLSDQSWNALTEQIYTHYGWFKLIFAAAIYDHRL